jgi:hypothetical protein
MANLCDECRYDWDTPILERLRLVADLSERLTSRLEDAGERAYEKPDPDVWSANEYVWHLADMLKIFAEWLHATRVHEKPVWYPGDANAMAESRGYAEKPLRTGLWSLQESCKLFLLEAIRIEPAREVTYKDWRDVTADEVIGFATHEAAHHIFDIQRLLAPVPTGTVTA